MFVIGEILAVDGDNVTIRQKFPYRTRDSKFCINSVKSFSVGENIRGSVNGDELSDIEHIMIDTCDNCGAQFELMSAQYLEYPIPGCCKNLPKPLREVMQLKEIHFREKQYRLWLVNAHGKHFITEWISEFDFLAGLDAELKLGINYSITAWKEDEHDFVENFLLDVIQLVDIK